MAIPASGDGQEVLRRGSMNNQSTDATSFDFTGALPTVGDETDTVPTNHIVTMLSIIWQERSGGAENINLYAKTPSDTIYLMMEQPISAHGTYIFTEKITLIGGDYLITSTAAGTTMDVWYSYLDQDWS